MYQSTPVDVKMPKSNNSSLFGSFYNNSGYSLSIPLLPVSIPLPDPQRFIQRSPYGREFQLWKVKEVLYGIEKLKGLPIGPAKNFPRTFFALNTQNF